MAHDRSEKRSFLPHQGTRLNDASIPEFAMDPGADSREERRLMRQRGAGNREIQNIDFGFAFATPAQISARRSTSKNAAPAISVDTPHRRNTSERDIPLPSPSPFIWSPRPPSIVAEDLRTTSTGQAQRKRRRLSDISNITRSPSQGLPVVSESDSPKGLDEDQWYTATRSPETVHRQYQQSTYSHVPSSPLFFPDSHQEEINADKENEPVRNVGKKRKRKSIGQQSLFKKKKRSSASSNISLRPTPIVEESTEQGQVQVSHSDLSPKHGTLATPGLAQEKFSSGPSSVPQSHRGIPPKTIQTSKRRKKRKSIIGLRKKRKSNDAVPPPNTNNEVQPENEPVIMVDNGQSPDTSSRHGPRIIHNVTAQRSPSPLPIEPKETSRADLRDEEDADETYIPEEATPEPTPAPRRAKASRSIRQNSSSSDATGSVVAKRKNSKFPILTHRMANMHALPTITEGVVLDVSNDPENAVDELATIPPTVVIKSAPNAVDVLAQACRETIDASIRGLKELPSAERSRQTNALQTFRSNLDTRLFDLSQSLDQRLHMEARLRKQRRERAELQARWLEIRKQRDCMALKMDAARRQHWENENMSRRAWDISQSAHRLETAMNRAEDQIDQESKASSLDFSLKELSQDISLKDGGGILNVLRHFNAQLEQTVKG